ELLAPARVILARRLPRLAINLWEGTDREVHHWMTDGRVDVGLVGPLLRPIPNATVVPLMEDPWYVACPVAHELARSEVLDIRQLGDVPYVMADGGCEPVVRALFDRAAIRPNVSYRAQSIDTILTMVAGGLGITLVPELGLQTFEAALIRTVPLSPRTTRLVAAVMPAGDNAPIAAHQLVAAMQQHIARRERSSLATTMQTTSESHDGRDATGHYGARQTNDRISGRN
ncbi:MAG: LysR family transcriptional regulator substrate-binding protein, partial [bacterium]